ncbi:MAG: polyribonucleotide nucleotidyltransferase, partial [Candidatus Cloacimonetes bacterium]|nr:polyribonucleotide nucleotidyltransferase [Candidatus Cloacimonadota bacterium]
MKTFDIKRKSITYQGRELILETGRMARQANGSVYISYGETSMLVTATASKEAREGSDFLPLTVDFIEKMYASGKIPGGFFKREAKPSTDATLNARLIDRAIRPLFPEGFRNEVQVIVTVLSYDGKTDPANIGILGASVALAISDIPFNGPLAGVSVGLVDDELVINPTTEQLLTTHLELDIAGTEKSLVMLEAGAQEISEAQLKEAIFFGHDAIRELIKFQNEFVAGIAKPKMEVVLDLVPDDITGRIDKEFSQLIGKDANILGKQERNDAFDLRQKEMLERY